MEEQMFNLFILSVGKEEEIRQAKQYGKPRR
mgnify:FL=1